MKHWEFKIYNSSVTAIVDRFTRSTEGLIFEVGTTGVGDKRCVVKSKSGLIESFWKTDKEAKEHASHLNYLYASIVENLNSETMRQLQELAKEYLND